MSKTFDLKKEEARVQYVLTKRNLPTMRASVGITLDVSGSIEDLFKQGTIQRIVEQLIPVGLKFDDNGNLDVYTFSDGQRISQVEGATAQNYQGFVQSQILDNDKVEKWHGTSYAPVINRMLNDYGFKGGSAIKKASGFLGKMFGGSNESSQPGLKAESTSGEAVINYFITDGENDDQDETYKLLRACQDAKVNMYFLFIGVGRASFNFLQKISDDFGNVGFLNVKDLQQFVNDDDIYEKLLPEELTQWLKQKTI